MTKTTSKTAPKTETEAEAGTKKVLKTEKNGKSAEKVAKVEKTEKPVEEDAKGTRLGLNPDLGWIQPLDLPLPVGVIYMGPTKVVPVVVAVQRGDTKKDFKEAKALLESFCDKHNLSKNFDKACLIYARPLGPVGYFVTSVPMENAATLAYPDILLVGLPFNPVEFKRDYQEEAVA